MVPRESAVIGLPGDVENQVRLDADHRNLCRYNLSVQVDRDNLKKVQHNIKELYDASTIRLGELHELSPPDALAERFSRLKEPVR